MKQLLTLILLGAILQVHAQSRKLTKVWETDSVIATPESVLPDLKKKILYVSLIDGAPWEADGKGGIAKLSPDGKIIDGYWVKGLNAPKGLGLYGNKLYAADIGELVVVNATTGKVEQKLAIRGAEGLNDVTVDSKGIVYVSDSKTGKIYRVENGKASLYLENIKGVNGVKAVGKDLYILGGPVLYKAGPDKKLTKISEEFLQGADGVEPVKGGGFIVSCWGGLIYYVSPEGKNQLLLDTRDKKINTADIGYDPASNIIYVPTFFKKSVIAFRLD